MYFSKWKAVVLLSFIIRNGSDQQTTPLRNVYSILHTRLWPIVISSLLTVVSALSSAMTYAQTPSLSPSIEIFEDKTGQRSLREIQQLHQQKQFKSLPENTFTGNYTGSNYWLHFRLNPPSPGTVFVEINNPRINQLSFFELTDRRLSQQIITGDSLPFQTRVFPHAQWVFPVMLDGKAPKDIYVMIAKRYEGLGAKVTVWSANDFEHKDRRHYLLWGLLAGLTLLVLLFTSVVWLATGDAVYGWFIMVILAGALHISAASGLGFQYLWPDVPTFNTLYPQTFSSWLMVLFQLYFMQHFLGQTPQNSRIFYFVRKFQFLIIGTLGVSIILLGIGAFPKAYFFSMLVISLFFDFMVLPLAIFSIFERIRKREKIVLFYTLVTLFKALVLLIYLTNVAFHFFDFDSLSVVLVNFLFDLIVLSLGVLYFGFTKYRLQNDALLTALHQHEQDQSQKIIEALEVERNRIAEDLYDDVGAMLSTAIGYISSAVRKPEIKERFPILLEARKLLDRAVENLRTVSHNLMPKNFAQLGLSKSLEETIAKVSQTSSVHLEYLVIGKEYRLNAATEVQIFRIAAELINDILKNSAATRATIQLAFGNESLNLMVEDDGPRTPVYNNLTSKVDFINGSLDVDAGPHGVTAIVEIPYQLSNYGQPN